MRTPARIATTVAVGALALTAIAAPVSAAPANKGTTTVVPSALTNTVLAGVAAPGYLDGGAVFGITGNAKDGTVEHVGGLYVNGAGGLLELRNFTINLNTNSVSGIVNDSFRAPLFYFAAGDAADGTVTLRFTSTASGAIVGSGAITGEIAGTATVDLK
ncbi:MAG TPA: hypothetical protein VFY23_12060 [Candidatus Limnocylindrales bacterium]|nr:hypothetical protein [Candidatus Limnocylindrales bacterium]